MIHSVNYQSIIEINVTQLNYKRTIDIYYQTRAKVVIYMHLLCSIYFGNVNIVIPVMRRCFD